MAQAVRQIARKYRISFNHVVLSLLREGLAREKAREKAFFRLAGKFRDSNDADEARELGEELGRFVFGE